MKILAIHFSRLPNESWFQFFTEIIDLVKKYSAEALGITPQFEALTVSYSQADEAIEFMRKSAETALMNDADRKRDTTFRGFVDAVKSARNHFDETKKQAADEISIVIEHYGNLANRAPDEETAGIYNFLQEMTGRCAPQIAALSLNDWIVELEQNNKAYSELVKNRNVEIASRTKYRMVTVRREAEAIYRDMVARIEASILLNNSPIHAEFVNELNGFVKQRRDVIAQRKGMRE